MPQSLRCISFDSYIKPQHGKDAAGLCHVVYLLIPTSNHNGKQGGQDKRQLYIF